MKEYTFGNDTSAGDLSLGKVKMAKRYNYPVLGTNTHTVAVTETYIYGGKEGRASKRDTQVTFNAAPAEAFTQSFLYDDLGNTAQRTYPGCTHLGCTPPPPQVPTPKTVDFGYTEEYLETRILWAKADSSVVYSASTIKRV